MHDFCAPVHSPVSTFMLSDVLLGICASASVRGLLSLAFCCVRSCICASACFELALVSLCSQCSSFVHMLMDTSCLLYSAILRSSIVSGLSPFFPSAWGLMVGLPGFVNHGRSDI